MLSTKNDVGNLLTSTNSGTNDPYVTREISAFDVGSIQSKALPHERGLPQTEGDKHCALKARTTAEPIGKGGVTIQLSVPELPRGTMWRHEFIIRRVSIQSYEPGPIFDLMGYKQREELSGQGVVIICSDGPKSKCFFTFSSKQAPGDCLLPSSSFGCNESKKTHDGAVTIRIAIPELQSNPRGNYRRHEFLGRVSLRLHASGLRLSSKGCEKRDEIIGRGVVVIHSDSPDPRCFLTFSAKQLGR